MSEVIGLPERESRRRLLSRLLVSFGIILALVAGYGTYALITTTRPDSFAPIERPTTPVVVAARAIDARTSLGAADLKVVRMDDDLVPSGAIADSASVIGRVTSVPLARGEAVLQPKLAVGTISSAPFTVVPQGETLGTTSPEWRALSIQVADANAVGGYLQAGDVVDFIFTLAFERTQTGGLVGRPLTGTPNERAARIVFERIPILARNAQIYTVRIEASSAERLALLLNADSALTVLLRAPKDDRATKAPGDTLTNELAPFLRIPQVGR